MRRERNCPLHRNDASALDSLTNNLDTAGVRESVCVELSGSNLVPTAESLTLMVVSSSGLICVKRAQRTQSDESSW